MRPGLRLTVAAFLSAVCAWPATAGANTHDDIVFQPAVGETQVLVVTLSDDAPAGSTVLHATYRRVSAANPPPASMVCPLTVDQNSDARLIDGIGAGPIPYSVSRSRRLELGVYAVCTYRAGRLSGSVIAGQSLVPGGGGGQGDTRKQARVSLQVTVLFDRARFFGRTRNAKVVKIQRRGRGHYRTIRRVRVRHNAYSTRLPVRRGQVYRAMVPGSSTTAPSWTGDLRIR